LRRLDPASRPPTPGAGALPVLAAAVLLAIPTTLLLVV
jgi:hypothetical protein